jgi:alpha-mannosidase
VVTAIKNAENGDDLIVRCVELAGKETTASLIFGFNNRNWNGTFGPCEIKTLRINRKSGAVKEVNLLEE